MFSSTPHPTTHIRTSKPFFYKFTHRVIDPPWTVPGVDQTDFFNYGHTVETWKDYCGLVYRFRQEYGMQKQISTFTSTADAHDSDLPAELRAAVAAQQYGAGGGGAPQARPPMPVRNTAGEIFAENCCWAIVQAYSRSYPLFCKQTAATGLFSTDAVQCVAGRRR